MADPYNSGLDYTGGNPYFNQNLPGGAGSQSTTTPDASSTDGFTPYKYTGGNTGDDPKQAVQNGYRSLFDQMYPQAQGYLKDLQTQNANSQNFIRSQMRLASPGNQQARLDRFRATQNDTARTNANQANLLARAKGLSGGYQSGDIAANYDQAARNTAAEQSRMNSPEYQQQMAQYLMSLNGQYAGQPILQLLQALGSGVYGKQDQQSQPNAIPGILGSLAGIALGKIPF